MSGGAALALMSCAHGPSSCLPKTCARSQWDSMGMATPERRVTQQQSCSDWKCRRRGTWGLTRLAWAHSQHFSIAMHLD